MIKQCVICDGDFKASPSDKKSTCSAACRSERARRHSSKGRPWSEDAKSKLSSKGRTPNLRKGTPVAAAKAIADPDNFHEAKVWAVVDPSGVHRSITNLKRTLINELGEMEGGRVERILSNMASRMRRGEAAWWTRCGWTLTGLPKDPQQDDG